MTAYDPSLIASLVAARAAIESALVALTQPETPEETTSRPQPETTALGKMCKHENRTSQQTFGVAEAWVCNDCGYEFRR